MAGLGTYFAALMVIAALSAATEAIVSGGLEEGNRLKMWPMPFAL